MIEVWVVLNGEGIVIRVWQAFWRF